LLYETRHPKKASRVIIEKYYIKETNDFHTNKRVYREREREREIAGFVTHLMERILKGPVRNISDNYEPEISALGLDIIEIDLDTKAMLNALDFDKLPHLQVTQPTPAFVGGRQTPAGLRTYISGMKKVTI
ncbi:unnamed protein product, partial [Candidula unifasciata]